jgi:hypothetical protein
MRKQYHFRQSNGDVLIWDCDRLVALTDGLPRRTIPLNSIRELDEAYWRQKGEAHMTCRELLEHLRLVQEADLAYPIILSADGRVMDGMHRVMKAALENRGEIEAVLFDQDPKPDYVNIKASDLPY